MTNTKSTQKKLLLSLLILAVLIAVLELTNTTHIFHKSPHISAPTKPITSLPHTSTNTPKKASTPTSHIDQGGATDKSGQPTNVSTSPSQWSTSASGLTVLKTPIKGGTFKPGDSVSGTASGDKVQFRLIDNSVGVIAQGPISVVNGTFTATVDFKAYSSSGRLDIFNVDPNGRETNEVQVTVNF